ncbi:tetratricopeptide repeat protein [Trinickia dinghuensis]|uniref:Tetratricopeptide repeat protein n=1 Tax=Trinickia dinghuensis TaxID=2291023 RepID=A0A3D8JSZ4_9BURK|nr:tetratricopeptide repeat-containing glycosyltransferase family protein [Trinickia dinghuensis]RDU96158.1 tetratricopeptide repeat protein [Trinickia dinghuensis]
MNPSVDTLLDEAQRHFQAGRLEEAARILRDVVDKYPTNGDAIEGLAYIAASRNEVELAADYFDLAIAHLPSELERLHNAAGANQAAGRHKRANELLLQCLQLAPNDLAILNAAGMSFSELGEHERALQVLARAGELSPRTWQIHYNIGRSLGFLGRFDEEIAAYRRAIELKPNSAIVYVNLGVALRDQHRFDEALRVFKKAIEIDPNHAGARTNRSHTNLLLGHYEHGWREYEWRWRDGGMRHDFGDNLWLGDKPIEGKTLLVHSEQGFGDTLQFVRYVAWLADKGARVVLRVQDPLLPLIQGFPGADVVIGTHHSVPAFDYHCPLMSLPHALKAHARPIPADSYLFADPALRVQWQARLGDAGVRPRIGVAWSGSRTHANDRRFRSVMLAEWASLFEVDAQFVSLVKDVREHDRETLGSLTALHDVSDALDTFADTAGLMAELDLVICIDTAVAHLAGALGKPVWVLLPYSPDWRWLLNRTDSPWYPSARLFRQPTRGDWTSVIAAARLALDEFVRQFHQQRS